MTPEIIALFYAADMMGATLNLVDPRYSVEGIREYIEEVDSHLLVCLNVVYERCRQAAKRTNVEKVIVLSPADSLPPVMAVGYKLTTPDKNKYASNVIRWKQFIKGGEGQSTAAEPYDPDHACVVVHTGGTTGSPKGVMLTDDCFNGIALQFQAYPKLFHRGQKLMNVIAPLYRLRLCLRHSSAPGAGLHGHHHPQPGPGQAGQSGAEAQARAYVRRAHPLPAAGRRPQAAGQGPFFHHQLRRRRRLPLPGGRADRQRFFWLPTGPGTPFAKGYGMTEVSSAATVAAGLDNKPGSVGIPMVNTVVAAFEPGTDQELPIGQRGELCISGPCLMKGYYNKPEETAILLRRHPDGRVWAHTGDMGYLDEDGFVFLDSRIKRMIIRHDGFKVFPSMIENVVSRHPAVHQCSVVGCADKDHTQGRLPFVYIVLKADTTAKKKQVIRELERMCAEELPEYVQPVAYKFISSMPMTPVGKVDYRQLEADISPRDY